MEKIYSYEEYKKALAEGRSVSTIYCHLGKCLVPMVTVDSFLVILLKDTHLDICYYKKDQLGWHIEHVIQNKSHRLHKIISSGLPNNKQILGFWNQVFFRAEGSEIYEYQDEYDQYRISDLEPQITFEVLIKNLKKEIQRWSIETLHNPLAFILGKWVACAPVAYCCQKLLNSREIRCMDYYEGLEPTDVALDIDHDVTKMILPIGDGVAVKKLLNDPVDVSVPLIPEFLSQEFIKGVSWADLVDSRKEDYLVGDTPYCVVSIGTGADMEGNIWIEIEGSDFKKKRLLIHEPANIYENLKRKSGRNVKDTNNSQWTDLQSKAEKENDLYVNDLERESRNLIADLVKKCRNNRYTTDSIYLVPLEELEGLKSEIEKAFEYDYILTDTNTWMTSEGWDENHKPVLLFGDMLIALALLMKEKNNILELEGAAYSELIRKTHNKDAALEYDSSLVAKRNIDWLKENQLIVIKGIHPEMTLEEQAEYTRNGGNLKEYSKIYADPYIRKRVVDRLGLYAMMVLTRDRDLRIRLRAACREKIFLLNEAQKRNLRYPCIISPESSVPILQVWYKLIKEIARRSGTQSVFSTYKTESNRPPLFSNPKVVYKDTKSSDDGTKKPASNKNDDAPKETPKAPEVATASIKQSLESYNDTAELKLPNVDTTYTFLKSEVLTNDLPIDVANNKIQELEKFASLISCVVTDANIWTEPIDSADGKAPYKYLNYMYSLIALLLKVKSRLMMPQEEFDALLKQLEPESEYVRWLTKLKESGLLVIMPLKEVITSVTNSLTEPRHAICLSKERKFTSPFFSAVKGDKKAGKKYFPVYFSEESNKPQVEDFFKFVNQHSKLSTILSNKQNN